MRLIRKKKQEDKTTDSILADNLEATCITGNSLTANYFFVVFIRCRNNYVIIKIIA